VYKRQPSVHTQEQAFEVLRKAIESNYTDIIAQDFVDNVLRRLEQINPIALPDRYMRALFRTKLEGDLSDVQQYENFLRAHKRRFLLDRLKELTQAYPDKEAVVREVVDQAYEYLQMIGLEHLLESFVRRMLDDPEVTRKAYERLTYRLIAAALPKYVRIKERHMRPEQLDEWRRRMRESAEQSPAASVAGKLPLTSADETA
jgi:ribosomal protein S10